MAVLQRSDVVPTAKALARAHDLRLADSYDPHSGELVPGLRRLERLYRGHFDLPWMPRQAAVEYRILVQRARSNWLRLVVQVISQRLRVDGFRSSADQEADAAAWSRWQANGLDAVQGRVHRTALSLSEAYCTVWPVDGAEPRIVGESPLKMYGDLEDADSRRLGLALKRWRTVTGDVAALYDDVAVWNLRRDAKDGWGITGMGEHGLGECPVVWFPNDPDLDGNCFSEIAPLLPIQNRINETLLDRLMSQKFGAFRQRWATGMAIPEDDNGAQIEPFRSMIDRLWMAEDPDVKFGEFTPTDLGPYISAVADDVRQLAAVSQVPPHFLLGDLANLSAEALVAAESGLKFRVEEKQDSFGEAWEKVMRLAAAAAGDEAGATDLESQVIWHDTEARSQGALVDGLQKMRAMGVPLRFLLEEYGLTAGTIDRVMEQAVEEQMSSAHAQAAAFGVDTSMQMGKQGA